MLIFPKPTGSRDHSCFQEQLRQTCDKPPVVLNKVVNNVVNSAPSAPPAAGVKSSPTHPADGQDGGDFMMTLRSLFTLLTDVIGRLTKLLGDETVPYTVMPQINPSVQVPIDPVTPRELDLPSALEDFSVRRNGERPIKPWSGLYESPREFGQTYNVSVHVAAVKAAMLRFGQSPMDVFREVTPSGDGYDVVMRDDYKVHISRDQLKQVASSANFSGDDAGMLKDAHFITAAFIARKKDGSLGNPPFASFDAALQASLRGEFPKRMLQGLGLVGHMQMTLPNQVLEKDAIGVFEQGIQRGAVLAEGAVDRHGRKSEAVAPGGFRGYVLN
ncbi:hypothetical protein [Pseudomonas mucidolens]|uniref:hypothetical protein n=1 Tax=Pseudomonas mucidolens TaxID=46679 RepID=UPI0030D99EC3